MNVLATLIAVLYVDRFGRKPLLTIGSWGMLLSLLLVAGAFFRLDEGPAPRRRGARDVERRLPRPGRHRHLHRQLRLLAGPDRVDRDQRGVPQPRAREGVAAATALNWFAAWAVTQTFLSVVDLTSTSGAFLIFAFFCAVTLWFVHRYVPETKGRTLEEVQAMWADPDEPRAGDRRTGLSQYAGGAVPSRRILPAQRAESAHLARPERPESAHLPTRRPARRTRTRRLTQDDSTSPDARRADSTSLTCKTRRLDVL